MCALIPPPQLPTLPRAHKQSCRPLYFELLRIITGEVLLSFSPSLAPSEATPEGAAQEDGVYDAEASASSRVLPNWAQVSPVCGAGASVVQPPH